MFLHFVSYSPDPSGSLLKKTVASKALSWTALCGGVSKSAYQSDVSLIDSPPLEFWVAPHIDSVVPVLRGH